MSAGFKLLAAALMAFMPLGNASLAETDSSQRDAEELNGFWVETSGHGVLAIDGDMATFSAKGDLNLDKLYSVSLDGNELTLTPAKGSNKFNKTMTTRIDWDQPVLSLNRDRYKFIPAPQIKPEQLDGYWYEETETGSTLEVRAMEYKDQASRYDFHWWEVNPGYGSYQQGLDEDVPMKIVNGFVFTNPKASDDYLHYAIKREGDTIYYVDSNGATWSETKTDTLKKYQPPKGFREMKDWMTGQQ